MRISDWSSDVCSSDLLQSPAEQRRACHLGKFVGQVLPIATRAVRARGERHLTFVEALLVAHADGRLGDARRIMPFETRHQGTHLLKRRSLAAIIDRKSVV